MKALVTYFSASGVTRSVAQSLAAAINAPIYEIRPEVPYTDEDLDWRDRESRSSLEMSDKNCRPALADKNAPVEDAEVIFVGYPVWWYREPVDISTLVLQASEVDEVRWFDMEAVWEEIQRDRSRFCVPTGGLNLLRNYLKGGSGED